MDVVLHPAEDPTRHRPDGRGRLSTVGHRAAFRAFVRAARRAEVRFMVVGGTFRDVVVRSASTEDIDVVLLDQRELPEQVMRAAGFEQVRKGGNAWEYRTRGRRIELQIAAVASSDRPSGPFAVAFAHAETTIIEGMRVQVPRLDDYVILKLLAAAADPNRRTKDLLDIHYALDAFPEERSLSVPAIRARLREVYGIDGVRLRDLLASFRRARRI